MSTYVEYFLNSNSNIVELELITITHPNFIQDYNLVRNAYEGVIVILSIGDSLTYQGTVSALKAKLLAAGVTPSSIGTKLDAGSTWADGRSSWLSVNYTYEENYLYPSLVQTVFPLAVGDEATWLATETAPSDFGGTWNKNPFIRTTVGGDDPAFVFNGYIFDMAFYLNRFSFADPDIVTVELGVNDVTVYSSADALTRIMRSLNIIYTQTRAALPNAKFVIILAGFPRYIHWVKITPIFKAVINTYCGREDEDIYVLPIFHVMDLQFSYDITTITADADTNVIYGKPTDFVHPTAQGRSQWSEMTLAAVMNLI